AVPSAVAAAQRGHQPAGGEGDAEGGQRTLADQLRSAVQQVTALVQQGVDLLARGLATHLGGSHAGKGGVGQFGLDVGLAQAQFLAGGGGGATQGLAGGTSGGLQVGAGFVEVALDVLARAGAHLRSPVWGMPGWQDVGIRPRCRCRSRYGCTAYCRTSRPRTLPRSISSTNWAGRSDRVLRRVARSSTWPALVAVITSPGRSPLAAARLPLATFSTSTPRPRAWRRVSGSSARVAPERRGSMVSPDRLRGCSRRVALSSSVRPSRITCSRTCEPTGCRPSKLCSACGLVMRWPPASTIRSPGRTPAAAAPELACTRATSAPCWPSARPRLRARRASSGWVSRPRVPRRTSPVVTSWWTTSRARLEGMARPRPMLPAALPRGLSEAVLMPTSSPRRLTSAPPELPGLMLASVWMKFW